MKYIVNFGLFWYDFIVGDDWTVAVSVVVALVLTALLAQSGIAWIWLPLAVGLSLVWYAWRIATAGKHH
jgi:O-antigen ligase